MWVQCFAIKRCTFFGLQGDGARGNRNLVCLRKVMTVGWCKWQLAYPPHIICFCKIVCTLHFLSALG